LGEDINLLVVSNTSGEGPSNRPDTFNQIPTTAQLEERVSEHGQKPQHNPAFMHSATLAPTPEVMDTLPTSLTRPGHLIALIKIRWWRWKPELESQFGQ